MGELSTVWSWIWATVAFLSELAALVALAVAGFGVAAAAPVRVLLGIGLPLLAAVLWGLFAAPSAPVPAPVLAAATKLLVFGAAVVTLAWTGRPWLAGGLALAALLGSLLSGSPEELSRSAAA